MLFSFTDYTMLRWFLVLMSLYTTSTVRVGEIMRAIYMPQTISSNSPFMIQFASSCNECLCYKLRSDASFHIINCVKDLRSCFYYANFSTNYTFLANDNVSVYLFQLPPALPTTVRMTSVVPSTESSMTASTKAATTSAIHTSKSLCFLNNTMNRRSGAGILIRNFESMLLSENTVSNIIR